MPASDPPILIRSATTALDGALKAVFEELALLLDSQFYQLGLEGDVKLKHPLLSLYRRKGFLE